MTEDMRGRDFLILLLLLALAVLAYLPALHGPFALDDIHNIVTNPSVRMTGLGIEEVQKALEVPSHLEKRRGAVYFTFALNYLAGGYDPFGYRLVNLLVLLLSVPFAFGAARLAAETWHDEATARRIAFLTAAAWALHPLLTNGVSYIVQRMTSLCGLFLLASFWAFLKGMREDRRWFAAAAPFWLAALACKEVALILPLVIVLFLALASPSGSRTGRILAAALAGAVAASQTLLYLAFRTHEAWRVRDFGLAERLLTEGRVVLHYLGLVVLPLPSRLNLDYDFPLSTALFDPPATAVALLVHVLLIGLSVRLARRLPLFSFGMLSFYLLQLLESTVLPLEIIFEHRVYIPAWFVILALADLLAAGARLLPATRRGAVLAAAGVIFCGLLFAGTRQRNTVWGDGLLLARDMAAKSPGKPRALHNLAVVLTERGKYEEALRHLGEALRIQPGNARAHNTAGSIFMKTGRLEGARHHFSEAARLEPADPRGHSNLAALHLASGDLESAEKSLQKALLADPGYSRALYSMARMKEQRGQPEEALSFYTSALRSDPGLAEAHFGIGYITAQKGDLTGASTAFLRALDLRPAYPEASYNLGVIMLRMGDAAAAESLFRRTLEVQPDYAQAERALEAIEASRRE